MPDFQEIMARPELARLDNDPSFRFGVSHMIAAYTKADNISTLMTYIERLPLEFQTITLQNIMRRDPEMIKEDCVKRWISVKGQQLF